MILKSTITYIDGLKESLTMANKLRDDAEHELNNIKYSMYKSCQGKEELEEQVNKLEGQVTKNEEAFQKAWEENPGLRERFEKMLEEHDVNSRICDEYREKADVAFKEGNMPQNKIFRRLSIERKDVCVELQQQIAEVRSLLLKKYGIKKYYEIFLQESDSLRRLKDELHEYETLELAFNADINKADKILRVLRTNAKACYEEMMNAWDRYYDIAMELGDIPEEYRTDAKVTYQPEMNQTKIIFGEEDPETGKHGHVQLNNENDEIIYYRPPFGTHGARNYTGKYQHHS